MIEPIRAVAIVALVFVGLFFTFVSTVGVVRLPDIYARSHTASQADTLGAGFALAGVAIALGLDLTAAKTVLLLVFIFITNPTAAHAIARAADEEGIEAWTTDDDRTDTDLAAGAPEVTDVGTTADGAPTAESGECANDGAADPADQTGGEH